MVAGGQLHQSLMHAVGEEPLVRYLCRGNTLHTLVFWVLTSLHYPRFLGPKIAFYWELLYKNQSMGAVVYMTLNGVGFRRLYP